MILYCFKSDIHMYVIPRLSYYNYHTTYSVHYQITNKQTTHTASLINVCQQWATHKQQHTQHH